MKERRSAFDDVKARAWLMVEKEMTLVAAKPVPVRLDELAIAYGIQYARFEPLWSTVKLVKTEGGFYILVNTDGPEVVEPAGSILKHDDGKWQKFSRPLRFSIAHEIAHLIFLEVADWE